MNTSLEEERRGAPTLLPVAITEPTITLVRRSAPAVKAGVAAEVATRPGSAVEIIVGEQGRIQVEGEAQRLVRARLSECLLHR